MTTRAVPTPDDPHYVIRVVENGLPPEATDASGFIGSPKTLFLKPDANLRTGIKDFEKAFGAATSLEKDALLVAAAIQAADVACRRGEREKFSRTMEITVPVVNIQAFDLLREDLEILLYTLSPDAWILTFEQSGAGTPEGLQHWTAGNGKTLLFSGGLDSFAGAVQLLEEDGADQVQLASHVTRNQATRSNQNELAEYLDRKFECSLERTVVFSGGDTSRKTLWYPRDDERENTQRTRSFTFLTIAALAARRRGKDKVVMIAENGQMAIHVPLSAGRTGAFSTHTAHPEFVTQVSDFFTKLLRYTIRVYNPYLYRTKGEVVQRLATDHKEAVPLSGSCWRGARVVGHTHCGECIPCLIRRIALEQHGLFLREYERDLFVEDVRSLPPEDDGRRNLTELAEFVHAFRTYADARIERAYPEVINDTFAKVDAIAMYRRFGEEAVCVFQTYPSVMALFPSD
jgi:7-cyano-7-deazaguanine synthase in queuosine biosynthesis